MTGQRRRLAPSIAPGVQSGYPDLAQSAARPRLATAQAPCSAVTAAPRIVVSGISDGIGYIFSASRHGV